MDTSVHDSQRFKDFFNEKYKVAYTDSAYVGQKIPEHMQAQICEKRIQKSSFDRGAKAKQQKKIKNQMPH